MTQAATSVYLESGTKRAFALALDWPGWARSGRTADAALLALADYAPRYAPVAARAGFVLPDAGFDVVLDVPGTGSTDFGAPDRVPDLDRTDLAGADAERLAVLVEAAWATFDDVVATASPTLRRGPRGGGRDRDEVVRHVLAAEAAYARGIGVRRPEAAVGDTAAVAANRAAVAGRLRSGDTADDPAGRWPLRYAARRIAWHVLDHAWEIEDKSE